MTNALQLTSITTPLRPSFSGAASSAGSSTNGSTTLAPTTPASSAPTSPTSVISPLASLSSHSTESEAKCRGDYFGRNKDDTCTISPDYYGQCYYCGGAMAEEERYA